MPRVFEAIPVDEEREIEDIIRRHPDQIEEGLVYLTHQARVGRGFLDILCVDSGGVLAVMELKITDDDGILTQALKYYDVVYRERDRVARDYSSKANIKPEEEPRIVLLAPQFSEDVKRMARWITPEIKLVEFDFLKHSRSGEKGLHCKAVAFEAEEGYVPTVPVERIIEYIRPPQIRKLCKQIIDEVQGVGSDLDPPKGVGTTVIRFRYKNRFLANLYTRRSFLWITYKRGESSVDKGIRSRGDWRSNRPKVLKALKKTYSDLGGAGD